MSQKIRISPTVRMVQVDQESMLLNVETGKIHALNSTARYVWGLLQKNGPLTIQEIQNLLKRHYEVDEREIAKGITDLIRDLQERKLIERISK